MIPNFLFLKFFCYCLNILFIQLVKYQTQLIYKHNIIYLFKHSYFSLVEGLMKPFSFMSPQKKLFILNVIFFRVYSCFKQSALLIVTIKNVMLCIKKRILHTNSNFLLNNFYHFFNVFINIIFPYL